MPQQVLAASARSLDIDILADKVAWWTRQVARDPRIGSEAKTEISARFAAGLVMVRSAVMLRRDARACGGAVPARGYLVGENAPETVARIDPGADERVRRESIMKSARHAR